MGVGGEKVNSVTELSLEIGYGIMLLREALWKALVDCKFGSL